MVLIFSWFVPAIWGHHHPSSTGSKPQVLIFTVMQSTMDTMALVGWEARAPEGTGGHRRAPKGTGGHRRAPDRRW